MPKMYTFSDTDTVVQTMPSYQKYVIYCADKNEFDWCTSERDYTMQTNARKDNLARMEQALTDEFIGIVLNNPKRWQIDPQELIERKSEVTLMLKGVALFHIQAKEPWYARFRRLHYSQQALSEIEALADADLDKESLRDLFYQNSRICPPALTKMYWALPELRDDQFLYDVLDRIDAAKRQRATK